MAMKTYSVTLEETTVTEAQEYYQDFGGKLSPLLNKLLANWNVIQKSNEKELPKNPKKKKPNIDDDLNLDVDLTGDVD